MHGQQDIKDVFPFHFGYPHLTPDVITTRKIAVVVINVQNDFIKSLIA
jgi:hypothetical protein